MGKFYAVANGRNKGVFTNWADCKKQVDGFTNARFKSFPTKAEADLFAAQGAAKASLKSSSIPITRGGTRGGANAARSSARGIVSRSAPYSRPARPMSTVSTPTDVNIVYTDGSALGNGKRGARAGWGVYWAPNDPRNKSGKVSNGEQTNNRGELQAIQEAVLTIAEETKNYTSSQTKKYEIRADSQYARDALIKWGSNWEKNGWRTSTGGEVKNQDLIQFTRSQIKLLRERGVDVNIAYIAGHAGHEGNEAADQLARSAASKRP